MVNKAENVFHFLRKLNGEQDYYCDYGIKLKILRIWHYDTKFCLLTHTLADFLELLFIF